MSKSNFKRIKEMVSGFSREELIEAFVKALETIDDLKAKIEQDKNKEKTEN